ncbi:MAG: nicotinamide-nucleotide amidohydrolase family protein [Burkholderiaceae bacterium]|nr:nicotinamide-nucleotide amidohydrolase family protein [Burkholderiaceae bacterium]
MMADEAERQPEVVEAAVGLGGELLACGWMVATAESCTGGGIARALTEVGGSSAWFERGFVTYSDQAKIDLLDVSADTLAAAGAVSEAVAAQMAEGALAHSRAQLALAVTGIAGPGGATPDKPVGTVCFGWAAIDAAPVTETRSFAGDRAAVRRAAALHALRRARELLPRLSAGSTAGPTTNS